MSQEACAVQLDKPASFADRAQSRTQCRRFARHRRGRSGPSPPTQGQDTLLVCRISAASKARVDEPEGFESSCLFEAEFNAADAAKEAADTHHSPVVSWLWRCPTGSVQTMSLSFDCLWLEKTNRWLAVRQSCIPRNSDFFPDLVTHLSPLSWLAS